MTQIPDERAHDSTPEVVRKARLTDLPGIVAIHQMAFSDFFLTRLGPHFLRKYYAFALNYRSGILLVAQSRRVLKGFACGFLDPSEFYRLMWRSKLAFAFPVLSAACRRPSLITKVLDGIQRIHASPERPSKSCELSSIAVAPDTAGKGLGRSLMRAFVSQAQSMDARCVYLMTDANGNDAANAFYRGVGFQHTRRFLQGERRWMNEYVLNG
jgi:colanic acid biosynthesis glycosyl transferase WcaI